MALLPADPRQRKQTLFLMVVLVLAGWYVGYTYLLSPRKAEIETAQQQLEKLERQNQRSRALAARRDNLQALMAVQERQLRIFEEFIPESQEVPELLDAISREAQLTGVEFTRLRPQASEPGDYYTKQIYELTVLGEYHDVGRYLARIASLPRIIKPTSLQLSPAPTNRATRDMEAPLEASFKIETFVLGPPADTTRAQGAASSG